MSRARLLSLPPRILAEPRIRLVAEAEFSPASHAPSLNRDTPNFGRRLSLSRTIPSAGGSTLVPRRWSAISRLLLYHHRDCRITDPYPHCISIPATGMAFFQNSTHLPPANSTNGTLCPSISSQNEVSSGSAAFIAIALLLGCMTQIAGSLVTTTCNRFWRISPLLNLAESLTIFFRIARPLFNSICTILRRKLPESSRWYLDGFERQGKSTVRAHAYALLAERLGNSRDYDYWLKQQTQISAPTIEQIVGLLDDIAELEDGTTLRPVVILPMILQFAKLCIITGGFWEVKALPLIYFWSWFWVEVLLLLVHGEKLGEKDMLDAERILLLSVAHTEVVLPSTRRRKLASISVLPSGASSSESQENNEPGSSAQQDPGITSEPGTIELQTRREEVLAQSEALLAHTVGERNVPNYRVTFRGKRAKLSTMEGTASNWMYQRIWGNMAGLFDGWSTAFMLWLTLGDSINSWLFLIGLYATGMFIPVYLLDMCIGAGLASVATSIKKSEQSFLAWTRDWVAFRAMIAILVYFTVGYSSEGTSKPDWLDWLG